MLRADLEETSAHATRVGGRFPFNPSDPLYYLIASIVNVAHFFGGIKIIIKKFDFYKKSNYIYNNVAPHAS
jgi:hypothetical protein